MTTRAGFAGLAAGCLLVAVLFYPLYVVWPGAYVAGWPAGSRLAGLVLVAVAAAWLVAGGGLAAWWSGARRPGRRAALGALAGALAALVLFCGLGAAAAGTAGAGPVLTAAREGQPVLLESVVRVVWWTHEAFWGLAAVGAGLGGVGALLVTPPSSAAAAGEFDLRAPQMALNAAITAVPASAVAVMLAVAVFAPLPSLLEREARAAGVDLSLSLGGVSSWPVTTALLLYLLSLAALALVTPHEARQATHRAGLDEVKMAAWVGIFVPPALAVWLAISHWSLALSPLTGSCLLVSLGLSVNLAIVLGTLILPRRARMPPPERLVEAVFFGSIANSQGPRLVVLCAGCGVVMVAPLYVSVGAAVLSLALMSASAMPSLGLGAAAALTPVELTQRLYLAQAAVGLGLMLAAAAVLSVIYLFYLWLGRRFSRATRRR